MEINKEEILLELENVLNTKEFSSDVKTEIKNILLTILEMNIDNKKIHIESIIDSLKKIDTIEFDLRDKLIRKEEISLDLNSNMTGYVKANSNLMVVVKEFQKCANFYHELVHITQNENSYNINPLHYSFPGIFQIAMKEGEAIYYQHKYQQHKFPNEYGDSLFLTYHTDFYRVCLELYKDMKNILGFELLEKWKNIDNNYDIMPEIDEYVRKEYGVRFSHIYTVWISILCYFSSNYSYSDSLIDLNKKELIHQQVLNKNITDKLIAITEVIKADNEYINILNSLIKTIDKILDDSELLYAKYESELLSSNQTKEEFTFEKHRDGLLQQKNASIREIEELKKELIKFSKDKELYEWYSLYTGCDLMTLDLHSLAVLKTAMLQQINKNQPYSIVSLYAVMIDENSKDNINK